MLSQFSVFSSHLKMPPGRKRRRRSVGRQSRGEQPCVRSLLAPRLTVAGHRAPDSRGQQPAYGPSSPRASPSPPRPLRAVSVWSAAAFSREQLHRALSFVDVSADGLITHKELRGSLMSTDMQAFDSKDFSRLLLRNVSPVQLHQEGAGSNFSRLLLATSPAASSSNSSLPPSSSSTSSY